MNASASEAKRRGNAKYRRSPKGRANRLIRNSAYRLTAKGKAAQALRSARYFAPPERRFKMYARNARSRRIIFNISFEDFFLLWGKPCKYCGSQIETIGLDRVDNSGGYTLDNVASCCSVCNYMKRTWPAKFFVAHCAKVAAMVGLAA